MGASLFSSPKQELHDAGVGVCWSEIAIQAEPVDADGALQSTEEFWQSWASSCQEPEDNMT